jgi:glycosyltransferase involved in cell wall biosynthesis
MKVLFYNHTAQVSGAERVLLMILAHLDRDAFQPVVFCPKEGPLSEMTTELGVPATFLPDLQARFTLNPTVVARYLRSFVKVIAGFRREVKGIKPDVIHANSIRAGLVATVATAGLNLPIMWHLHDLLPRHPLSAAIRLLALFSSRSRMIAVSEAVARNFAGNYKRLQKRVHVIFNGIECGKFYPDGSNREQTRAEFGLTEQEFAIGIVGQLTPRKGQLELIRAFAGVLREVPDAVLFIVGASIFNRDDEYAELLQNSVRELNLTERVRFTGNRNDIPSVMQSLDLIVINSSVEPFGLVAAEAMACGTPLLAPITGGLPEIIQHDVNGILVPPGDQAALTRSIIDLARKPEFRNELASRALSEVDLRFSVKRYIAEIEAMYSFFGILITSFGRRTRQVNAPALGRSI